MQKKVLVVAAVLALFVCGGAFAQEAEVPETEAPVAETPETEAPAAESSSGGSSILDTMYAGLDIGLGVNGATNAPHQMDSCCPQRLELPLSPNFRNLPSNLDLTWCLVQPKQDLVMYLDRLPCQQNIKQIFFFPTLEQPGPSLTG